MMGQHSGTTVIEGQGFSVWSLHVLFVSAWVFSWYSGSLPQSKNMQIGVRLFSYSKLLIGVNVSVDGCLSPYVRPAMNCRDVPRLHSMMLI